MNISPNQDKPDSDNMRRHGAQPKGQPTELSAITLPKDSHRREVDNVYNEVDDKKRGKIQHTKSLYLAVSWVAKKTSKGFNAVTISPWSH